MIQDLNTKGYFLDFEPNLIDLNKFIVINVEFFKNLKLDNWDSQEKVMIENFSNYINKKYMDPNFERYEMLSRCVWDGVDEPALEWHTDIQEGHDLSFLYYFDDTNHTIGGQIELSSENEIVTIYPKHGTILFFNQVSPFKHKATRSTMNRRVVGMTYKTL